MASQLINVAVPAESPFFDRHVFNQAQSNLILETVIMFTDGHLFTDLIHLKDLLRGNSSTASGVTANPHNMKSLDCVFVQKHPVKFYFILIQGE